MSFYDRGGELDLIHEDDSPVPLVGLVEHLGDLPLLLYCDVYRNIVGLLQLLDLLLVKLCLFVEFREFLVCEECFCST